MPSRKPRSPSSPAAPPGARSASLTAPSPAESLLDPRALRRIASLELVARKIVEGTFAGHHHSPVHGFSTDFLQHRAYVHGDDIRHLDWKVFGKTDRFYVREYEDDTNLRATLVVDASGSMEYASGEVSKLHYAVRLAAATAYLLNAQHDAIGLAVFAEKMRVFLPPRGGARQLGKVYEELSRTRPGGETALGETLRDVVTRLPRKGLVILFSDGFDEVAKLADVLALFRHRGHEVVFFHVLDRQEVDFKFSHWTQFECLEEAGAVTLVDPAQVRQSYLERFAEFQQALRQSCHDQQIDFVPVVTDRAYDEALAAYLAPRRT